MEIKDLKKISISNLILIILNDKNIDVLRKCAEAELRERVKYVGWEFDDLLHFDDKVIQKRGLDVNNYLNGQSIKVNNVTFFKELNVKQLYFSTCQTDRLLLK